MKEKMTSYRCWVMSFIFVIYTIANADRANIGFALPYIREEFQISNTEAGLIISLFFGGYALFQIPSGFIISKLGVKKGLAGGMFLTSIFTAIMGFVDTAAHLKFLRFFVGVAEAPVAIGSTSTINNWFPTKEKGTASGIFLAGSKVGPLIVPPLCAWIIMTFGWREIFIFFAIPGALLSIFWYFMVSNKPEESRFASKAEVEYINSGEKAETTQKKEKEYKLWWVDRIIRAKKVEPLVNSQQVFRCWDIFGIAFGYFFMVGTVEVLMSWLPTYLIKVKHFEIMSSALLAASPFAGTVLGNFVGGWLSDHVFGRRRKLLMMVSAVATSITMYALVYAPEDMYLLALLLFTTGFLLALGYSAFAAYPMGRTDKNTYPVAFSVVNTGGQLGGFCFPILVGVILDKFNWDMVFAALAVGSVLCLLAVFSVIEPVEKPVVKE